MTARTTNNEPHIFWTGSNYLFVDDSGNIIGKPHADGLSEWELLLDFHAGFASFRVGELWGFVDHLGNVALEPRFECNWNPIMNEGLAFAGYSGDRFYFNLAGDRVLPGPYVVATCFKEGMAAVKFPGRDTCSVIDPKGILLSELPIHLLWDMCWVKPQWDWNHFVGSIASKDEAHSEYPGLCGIFNWRGECLFEPRYPRMTTFHGSTACFSSDPESPRPHFGLVDRSGTEIHPCTLFGDCHLSEGMVAAGTKRNLLGYLNTDGEWIIEPRFHIAHPFSQGLAFVGDGQLGFGYINTSGEYVIPPGPVSHGGKFRNGVATVVHRGRGALINRAGEVIWKNGIGNP